MFNYDSFTFLTFHCNCYIAVIKKETTILSLWNIKLTFLFFCMVRNGQTNGNFLTTTHFHIHILLLLGRRLLNQRPTAGPCSSGAPSYCPVFSVTVRICSGRKMRLTQDWPYLTWASPYIISPRLQFLFNYVTASAHLHRCVLCREIFD